MTLTIEEINDTVSREKQDRARYIQRATNWEKMYFSQQWERTPKQSVEEEGKELVTLPTAFNTVHLGMRLINNSPKITCPPSATAQLEDDINAKRRERFLTAMYQRANAQQQMDIVDSLKWLSFVRGRHAVQILWIYDAIPKELQKSRFPFLIRPLDPFSVGVVRGPYWTDFAYLCDEDVPAWKLRQQYPGLSLKKVGRYPSYPEDKPDDDKFTVTDAWWTDRGTGRVWNAVVVGTEFAKEPVETDYPEVPIIEGFGDTTQAWDSSLRGLSILHPMEGTWEYTNRLTSQLATGMLWYFWPHIAVMEPEGGGVDENITVRPGRTHIYPTGTDIRMVQMDPNVPLARELLGQLEAVQQQSTFPGVMYGQAPGELQAGYGVNILAQAAAGRTMAIRRNLEMTLEAINRIALGIIDSKEMGGKVKGGVHAWGLQDGDGVYEVSLSSKEVKGYYENTVKLASETISDEMQRVATGIQMFQAGLISADTFRNHILPPSIVIPSDEQKRIEMEKALQSDEMRQKVTATAFIAYAPDIWKKLVEGTALEPIAWQAAGETPPGYHKMPDGTLMKDSDMMGPGGPGGPMPPGPPMGPGGPPGMGPGGPPPGEMMGPPGMMGPGGPPPGMGPGGPPPGMMPPSPEQLPPGLPPGGPPMGANPLQPEAIPTAVGGGIPPEMQGQMTPEQMGLPYDLPPEIWAQMTGNPMTDGEILRRWIEGGGM